MRRRWVHLDACEAAYDKPLLYERGWGKTVTYVIAAGTDGIADVTRRYTADWTATLPRRGLVGEDWLSSLCTRLTRKLRDGLPPPLAAALAARDAAEQSQLAARPDAAAAGALPGRQSGGQDWVAARGEGGAAAASSSVGPVASSAPDRPPTRYFPSPDGDLPEVFRRMGRLIGGAYRAAGEACARLVCQQCRAASTKCTDSCSEMSRCMLLRRPVV